MDKAWQTKTETVKSILQETEAMGWWIDAQIDKGKTDDEIAAGLPWAWAFITGRHSLADLHAVAMRKRLEGEAA